MKHRYFAKRKIWTSSSNHDKRFCHLAVCDERRTGAAGNVMQWMNQVKELNNCAEFFVLTIYLTQFPEEIERNSRLSGAHRLLRVLMQPCSEGLFSPQPFGIEKLLELR